ncbi:MAG: hypothetical protein JSW09_01780 [Pseudomonadota bacterium]|nr:MAG: hypothetical protein JSW09_01780 [Pseudomonadota bacterium]
MPADFQSTFRGRFSSLLSWRQFEQLCDTLRARADQTWYIYAIGLPPPAAPASSTELGKFLDAIDPLLRHDHREDYCGIVYVDDIAAPTMVKIFDPFQLGTSCGSSKHPPLPGWILSRTRPQPFADARPLPANRQRWWQGLWV